MASEFNRWPINSKVTEGRAKKEGRKMQLPIDRRSMRQPIRQVLNPSGRSCNKALGGTPCTVFCHLHCTRLGPGDCGKDLRVFYQQKCAGCHGPDGSAVSAEGKKLSGQDFTDPDLQRRTRDDKMVKTILKGKFFGWAMPSFKDTLTPRRRSRWSLTLSARAKRDM